jgi:RNA polymerase sigma factor FliA
MEGALSRAETAKTESEAERPSVSLERFGLTDGGEGLVGRVCAGLRRGGISAEYEDMLAFGRQGLLEAAQRFDESQGIPFEHFAYRRVRGAVLDGVRKMGNWSRRAYERVQLLRAAGTVTEGESLGATTRNLSPEQAAERIRTHMALMVSAMTIGVFAERTEQGELVAARLPESVEDQLGEHQIRKIVNLELDGLPEPDGDVLHRYYRLEQSLEEIAEHYGLSKSWVCRIHARAVRRLGQRVRASL